MTIDFHRPTHTLMEITLPDPHLGRCQNYRMDRDAFGYQIVYRCLDYQGHDDACTFPSVPPMVQGTRSYISDNGVRKWTSPLEKYASGD